MKLRIQGDALRLRLTRPEVLQLAEAGEVTAEMRLGLGSSFVYRIRAADVAHLGASMDGGALTVVVPRGEVAGWPDDERVGFEGTQDAGDGRRLALLVEKDFDCLHRRPEEADLFPHPDA